MSNIIQSLPFYLNQPLGASDTTIQVRGLKDSRGNLITAMPSGVALIHVTIEPKSPTNQEIISFTGITDDGNGVVTLTGVTRNLNPVSPFTALTADVPHANNSTCVISNNPQIFQDVVMTNEARTVTAVVTFGASPVIPTGVNPTDAVNKSQLDATVAGTVPSASTTVLGSVRVATDPTKTLGTATMTIASPCVVTLNSHALTANDTIRFTTTGALPTGLVVGTTYYVISTGLTANTFQLASTLGGSAINTSGSQSGTHTLYRTTPYAVNDQDTRLPPSNPTNLYMTQASMVGVVTPYAGSSAPSGWLICDGSAVSRTTYASLFAITSTTFGVGDGSTTFNLPDLRSRIPVGAGTGTKVATFSSRSSNVITVTGLSNALNNEFQTGQAVVYNTSGSVITGLTNATTYYVVRISNTTFSLATTLANAQNGTVITLSSDGTGTQTFTQTLTARTLGHTGGEENHAMSITELLAHTHTGGASGASLGPVGGGSTGSPTGSTGGNVAMNIMQPFAVLNYIIKT